MCAKASEKLALEVAGHEVAIPIGEVGGVVKPQIDARLRSETRKYALSVTLVTQFLDALSNDTRAALLGNAKTLVASDWPKRLRRSRRDVNQHRIRDQDRRRRVDHSLGCGAAAPSLEARSVA